MLQIRPMDTEVPIFQRLQTDLSPVVLENIFQVAEADIPALLEAWAHDAAWMKQSEVTFQRSSIAGSPVAPC